MHRRGKLIKDYWKVRGHAGVQTVFVHTDVDGSMSLQVSLKKQWQYASYFRGGANSKFPSYKAFLAARPYETKGGE